MRELSDQFLHDLTGTDGLLRPIHERVKQDHTLMLAIRHRYINIYYRGGSILKLSECGDGSYEAFFDEEYNKDEASLPRSPQRIVAQQDSKEWADNFPYLKQAMDRFFSRHSKPEREYQQLVARENNCSVISNETEYFVVDIEFAERSIRARFDLLAIRWLASQRKNGSNCCPVFIEMKYGDAALDGASGLVKHLQDIESVIGGTGYPNLLTTMEDQFDLLDRLDLLRFNPSKAGTKVKFATDQKPEVIVVLANHNPRSQKLVSLLADLEAYDASEKFDLRFFAATFAGYALHSDCMFTLPQFRDLLTAQRRNARNSSPWTAANP